MQSVQFKGQCWRRKYTRLGRWHRWRRKCRVFNSKANVDGENANRSIYRPMLTAKIHQIGLMATLTAKMQSVQFKGQRWRRKCKVLNSKQKSYCRQRESRSSERTHSKPRDIQAKRDNLCTNLGISRVHKHDPAVTVENKSFSPQHSTEQVKPLKVSKSKIDFFEAKR